MSPVEPPRFSWRVHSDTSRQIERYWLFRQPGGWALLTTVRATGAHALDHFNTLFDVQIHVEQRLGSSVWAAVSRAAGFSANELYERS